MTYNDALYILSNGKPIPKAIREECIEVLSRAVSKAERYDRMRDHKIKNDITSKFVKSHIDKAIWNLECAHNLDEDSVDVHVIRIIKTYIK